MNRYVIKMENITKVYRMGEVETRALRGIDFNVEPGEFIAVMGPSGSGKSTLMNIVGCLDTPTDGFYSFEGKDIKGLEDNSLAEIRNQKIGFVFQQFNLLARTSALENIILPQLYSGNRLNYRRARRLLKMVGLQEKENNFPNQLSGGQQQRVAIARALINKPSILLADEPTGALDTKSGSEVMDIFKEINKQGTTVILVTHERYIAEKARRIVHIKDGKAEDENAELNSVSEVYSNGNNSNDRKGRNDD